MIKLIVTDLDGTLLADDKSLPTDFWDVEQQLNERNITLVIASGRPYHNMVSVFEKIRHRKKQSPPHYQTGTECIAMSAGIEYKSEGLSHEGFCHHATAPFCYHQMRKNGRQMTGIWQRWYNNEKRGMVWW